MILLRVLFLSVFKPKAIPRDTIEKYIFRYGFIFILIRWLYYSLVFSLFRDYKNDWSPFLNPPFGLTIETYAFWQSKLAVLFGFLLMMLIAGCLSVYIKLKNKQSISSIKILNILGFAYFVPFIILQPLDSLTIAFFGWNPLIIVPLHTAFLMWEAIVSIILINRVVPFNKIDGFICVCIQLLIWISLCAILWR